MAKPSAPTFPKLSALIASGLLMLLMVSVTAVVMLRKPRASIEVVDILNAMRDDVEAAKATYTDVPVRFSGKLLNLTYDISANSWSGQVLLLPTLKNGRQLTNAIDVRFKPNDKRDFQAARSAPTEITGTGICRSIFATDNTIHIIVDVD